MTVDASVSPHRLWVMPVAPPAPLHSGEITIRPPEPADVEAAASYAVDAAALAGVWLPLGEPAPDPALWAPWFVRELCLGWSPLGGRFGGGLVIDAGTDRFVGLLNCRATGPRVLELTYGVAPDHRGRGIATAATNAVTDWALSAGFERVELEVSTANAASHRVAAKTGFSIVGRQPRTVAATGERYEVVQLRRRREA